MNTIEKYHREVARIVKAAKKESADINKKRAANEITISVAAQLEADKTLKLINDLKAAKEKFKAEMAENHGRVRRTFSDPSRESYEESRA